MMRWLPLILLVGCRGCKVALPPSNNNTKEDSETPDSPGEESTPTDDSTPPESQPPLFCDVQELEPNNTVSTPQVMPMEKWICGHIDTVADADFYSFTTTEPGWVTIEVLAAAKGSSADMVLSLTDTDRSVGVYDSYLSTDPRISFPADEPGTYVGWLSEGNPLLSGEEYAWYFRASISKPALGWSRTEVEPNGNTQDKAEEFTIDERVFAIIEDSEDTDWYHIVTPETATAIILDVDAFRYGSPMDTTMIIRDAAGTLIKRVYSGEIDYDFDPHVEIKTEGSQDWYVQIFNPAEKGSRFPWYTLSITAEYE